MFEPVRVADTGGARKRRAVKLTGETQVFEEGSMGEAPGGGSLSTYKELCALATDMGQPDLVYRFMDLANHHASLNSSRGAAFGWDIWLLVHSVCIYGKSTAMSMQQSFVAFEIQLSWPAVC